MAYMKLLLLAPVYLETSTDLDQNALYGTDFISTWELRIESLLDTEQNKSAALVSRKTGSQVTRKSASQVAKTSATQVSRSSNLDLLSSLPTDIDRNYLNFPFLTDRKTVMYLTSRDSKVMFIMRGLSGSGKSTIVNIIRSSFKRVSVCSSDDFFYKEKEGYKFDETLLRAAHESCQLKAKQSCKSKVPIVVIDNTNVKRWEFKFYAELAKVNGYVVILVQPKTPWRLNAEELAARNTHGVTAEILRRKISMFDDVIPSYYGWFLNERQSKCLSRLCSDIFLECLSKFPTLKQDFLKELRIKLENVNEEAALGVLAEYYSTESRTPLLHCTAKFCGWGKVPEAKEYHQRSDVQEVCGQMFVLSLAGLVITKKSIGARVSLESSAAVYFDRPEEREWVPQNVTVPQGSRLLAASVYDDDDDQLVKRGNRKAKKNPLKFLKKQQRKQKNVSEKREKVCKDSLSRENGRFLADGEEIHSAALDGDIRETGPSFSPDIHKTTVSLSDMFPFLKYYGKSRSSHVTVNTVRGVESRQVNFDILHACDVEASYAYSKSDFVPVSRGHACYYGDGLCCVYFNKPLNVSTLYSGYY